MANKKPSSLSELLAAKGAGLATLTAQAQRLETLRRRVLQCLPAELVPHCLGADLKHGRLTLFMDSGAWTTALRYQHQALLAAVQKSQREPCTRLQLKVLPDPLPGVPPKPAPRELSADTRRLLESTAAGLDDTAVAASLKRLARDPKSRR